MSSWSSDLYNWSALRVAHVVPPHSCLILKCSNRSSYRTKDVTTHSGQACPVFFLFFPIHLLAVVLFRILHLKIFKSPASLKGSLLAVRLFLTITFEIAFVFRTSLDLCEILPLSFASLSESMALDKRMDLASLCIGLMIRNTCVISVPKVVGKATPASVCFGGGFLFTLLCSGGDIKCLVFFVVLSFFPCRLMVEHFDSSPWVLFKRVALSQSFQSSTPSKRFNQKHPFEKTIFKNDKRKKETEKESAAVWFAGVFINARAATCALRIFINRIHLYLNFVCASYFGLLFGRAFSDSPPVVALFFFAPLLSVFVQIIPSLPNFVVVHRSLASRRGKELRASGGAGEGQCVYN